MIKSFEPSFRSISKIEANKELLFYVILSLKDKATYSWLQTGKFILAPIFHLTLWYHFGHSYSPICSLAIIFSFFTSLALNILRICISLSFMIHYTLYQSQIRFYFPLALQTLPAVLHQGDRTTPNTQALFLLRCYKIPIYLSNPCSTIRSLKKDFLLNTAFLVFTQIWHINVY